MDATQKDLKVLLNQIKAGAKKRGIAFELTVCDLNEMSFPITCPVLGMPLKFNTGSPKNDSYSVDRIDSDIGYTVDNIIIISNRANVLKSNATLNELECLASFYKELSCHTA